MEKLKNILTDLGENITSIEKNYNRGIVLSGGAAHGLAHLGVLKALEEMNLKPDIISGVSAGSIAGCLYADGYHPEEILEIFNNKRIFKFVKPVFRKNGIFKITGLKKVLNKYLRTKNMEDLNIPLIVAVTNIDRGITEYYMQGKILDIIIASSSIPVVFKPVKINGNWYIDGGVTNNFPVEPLETSCKELIGVNANPVGSFNPEKGIGHIALYSFHLSIASRIIEKKKHLTYFIEPDELKNYSYYDTNNAKKIMEIGYKETLKVFNKN